jgi:hypothetical protein
VVHNLDCLVENGLALEEPHDPGPHEVAPVESLHSHPPHQVHIVQLHKITLYTDTQYDLITAAQYILAHHDTQENLIRISLLHNNLQ